MKAKKIGTNIITKIARIAIVVILSVFCGTMLASCAQNGDNKNVGSGGNVADKSKWNVYDGLAVGFISDADCPNGDVIESKSSPELNAKLNERHYMVADFTLQAPQDNDGRETVTAQVKITPSSAVSATVQETQTADVEEQTADGSRTIRARYKIPDRASVQRKIRLVVRIDALESACAEIELSYICRDKLCPVKTLKVRKQAVFGYTEGLKIQGGVVNGVEDKTVDKIIIPNMAGKYKITEIKQGAFSGLESLSKVDIPESVSKIGAGAFSACKNLAQINIPDGVTAIGNYTFSACAKLEKIVLPSGLIRIGDEAFKGCVALTEINLPDGVTKIGSKAFYECDGVIDVQDLVHYVGKWVVGCESSLNNAVEFRADTVGISDQAFRGKSITEVKVPSSIKYIGNWTFGYCGTVEMTYDGTEKEWQAVNKDIQWNYHTTVKMSYKEKID